MPAQSTIPCWLSVLLLASALTACKGDDAQGDTRSAAGTEALPAPQGGRGSVTGMPDAPGPGQVSTPGDAPPIDPQVVDPNAAVDAFNPELGMLPGGASGADGLPATEPTPQDAIAVVRDYYAAINAQSFARAYALWSDGGNASGQSPQQFADGFAQTAGVTVQIGAPGDVDAAAGSRFIELPVTVRATQRDGQVREYIGQYTLRRSMVDGADAEQRAWRIGSADLRERTP